MPLLRAIIGIAWIIVLIWAFVDIYKTKNKDTGWKLIWTLVCLIPLIGVFIYYFVAHGK